jgi:hypothetical protein|tara:strand:+ start:1302 stop:1964 length:663 start_codon:yes stop_codon:yes gene_type:complete
MIKGDSSEYNFLARWTKELRPQDFYLTVEIGVREGYSSNIIMEMLKDRNHFHIGIDPYGDLLYKHLDKQGVVDAKGQMPFWTDFKGKRLVNEDGTPKIPTYPNSMKQNFFSEFKYHENFTLFQLEDTEYFNAFGGGVPIYKNGKKKIINTYDLIFFDGPHTTEKVMEETVFFGPRSRIGTRFIFDDIHAYDMSIIAYCLETFGFKTIEVGGKKICLEKQT